MKLSFVPQFNSYQKVKNAFVQMSELRHKNNVFVHVFFFFSFVILSVS